MQQLKPEVRQVSLHLIVTVDLARAELVRGLGSARQLLETLHNFGLELSQQVQFDPCLREFAEVRQFSEVGQE